MKKIKIILLCLFIMGSVNLLAQPQASIDKIMGKWTTSDSTTIVVSKDKGGYVVKSENAVSEAKILFKNIVKTVFIKEDGPVKYEGIAIHPADGKEYKTTIYLAASRKRLSFSYYVGTIGYKVNCTKQ